MTAFFRFIGILNAAVWCGAAVFVMVGVPALFAPGTKSALGDWNTGIAAQAVLARFFILQYCCLGIGVTQVLIEWWFLGRALLRPGLGWMLGVGMFALVSGLWIQPKLIELHRVKYQATVPEQKLQADRSFKMWHGATQGANLLVMGALLMYVYQVTRVTENRRFVSSAKLRG